MKYIMTLLVAAMAFVGCDTIKEDDRYITTDKTESKKVVLLEDFSGVKCVNCPVATKTADNLLNLYPENLVVMVLHGKSSGSYGTPYEGEQDFRLDGVDELFNAMGGNKNPGYIGYPFGMVNRNLYGTSEFLSPDKWATYVAEELAKPQMLDIKIKKTGESANGVDVEVDVNTLGKLNSQDYSLVVVVTETNIKGSQLLPDGSVNPEYKHKHVLRSFENGTWGEAIALAEVGESTKKSYSIKFGDKMVKENCSVVAYVYNTTTKREIVQAAILPMSSGDKPEVKDPKLELDKISHYMAVDELVDLKATLTDTTGVVTWTSSNEDVAMVTEDGSVLAVGVGSAYIEAKLGRLVDTCKVTVLELEGDIVVFRKEGDELVPMKGTVDLTLDEVGSSPVYSDGVIFFKGVIFNNVAENNMMIMRVTRDASDLDALADEGCVGITCIPSTGEAVQDFKGRAMANASITFDYYFKPQDKTITRTFKLKYEFFAEGNEEDKVTVNVTYNWTPFVGE